MSDRGPRPSSSLTFDEKGKRHGVKCHLPGIERALAIPTIERAQHGLGVDQEVEEPDDDAEQRLVARNTQTVRVKVRPERAGTVWRDVVVNIVNVVVLIVLLDPFAAPESVNDLLGLVAGEENLAGQLDTLKMTRLPCSAGQWRSQGR